MQNPKIHSASPLTQAEEAVTKLKREILVLRGDFEAKNQYPSSEKVVRQKAAGLAEELENLHDDSLSLGYQIIKYDTVFDAGGFDNGKVIRAT